MFCCCTEEQPIENVAAISVTNMDEGSQGAASVYVQAAHDQPSAGLPGDPQRQQAASNIGPAGPATEGQGGASASGITTPTRQKGPKRLLSNLNELLSQGQHIL